MADAHVAVAARTVSVIGGGCDGCESVCIGVGPGSCTCVCACAAAGFAPLGAESGGEAGRDDFGPKTALRGLINDLRAGLAGAPCCCLSGPSVDDIVFEVAVVSVLLLSGPVPKSCENSFFVLFFVSVLFSLSPHFPLSVLAWNSTLGGTRRNMPFECSFGHRCVFVVLFLVD